MHRIFQGFIDRLAEGVDEAALRHAMAEAATALGLPAFAYLSMPYGRRGDPRLITTYPSDWTSHYLENRYERLDPVIIQTLSDPQPFEWGLGAGPVKLSPRQRQLFDEAGEFGIRYGFTVPIHDSRGPIAAMTFAADERLPAFRCFIEKHGRVLQLMSMYFHAHARRTFVGDRIVDGVTLSPREFECLRWAALGKSAWEIGCILGISRRTAAFHLDNAKAKLGVRSICQAVARLAASKPQT